MPKHTELTSVEIQGGRYRLCLDNVIRDDQDGQTEFAFVWRGTTVSRNGFVPNPAYFDWQILGRLIRQAVDQDLIPDNEFGAFVKALLNRR